MKNFPKVFTCFNVPILASNRTSFGANTHRKKKNSKDFLVFLLSICLFHICKSLVSSHC